MKRVVASFLFFIFLILCSVVALAYPEVGHQFYGYAGSGATVTAKVGTLSYSTSVQSNKYYGYENIFFVDAASDDMSGVKEGEIITFYLDGIAVTTATFKKGGATKLDFADDPATAANESAILSTASTSTSTNASASSTNTSSSLSSSTSSSSSSSKSKSKSSSKSSNATSSGKGCFDKWNCKSWGSCASNGLQTRICDYAGNCTTEGNQSDTRQKCTYVAPVEKATIVSEQPEATCYDKIKNQGERGVDCGGPCDACPVAPVVKEETKTNWLYVGVGIFIILLIIAIILAHRYKDKLQAWWEKVRGKKPSAGTALAGNGAKQAASFQRPNYPQQYQYRPQQQYVKK